MCFAYNMLMCSHSFLYVPGDRPERFDKAVQSGADGVIVDLDDGVAPEAKLAARDTVAQWLAAEHPVYVRVNRTNSEWCQADLAAVTQRPGLLGIVVPDAETPAQLSAVASQLPAGVSIIALTESALGIWNAYEIAINPAVTRLAFGALDLMRDTGIQDPERGLLFARSRIVMASRAARIEAPLDGVTTSLDDLDAVRADTIRARQLGFSGKQCIHPKHVAVINQAFEADALEIEWARSVLEAVRHGAHGAIRFDGQMIDRPVIERAKQILERSD